MTVSNTPEPPLPFWDVAFAGFFAAAIACVVALVVEWLLGLSVDTPLGLGVALAAGAITALWVYRHNRGPRAGR